MNENKGGSFPQLLAGLHDYTYLELGLDFASFPLAVEKQPDLVN